VGEEGRGFSDINITKNSVLCNKESSLTGVYYKMFDIFQEHDKIKTQRSLHWMFILFTRLGVVPPPPPILKQCKQVTHFQNITPLHQGQHSQPLPGRRADRHAARRLPLRSQTQQKRSPELLFGFPFIEFLSAPQACSPPASSARAGMGRYRQGRDGEKRGSEPGGSALRSPLPKLWVLALKPQQPAPGLVWGEETASLTVSHLALKPAAQTALLSSCCALHTRGSQNG